MFLFNLAEKLHMTVGELLRKTDSREISEWQALFYLRGMEKTRQELDRLALAGAERLKSMR